MTISRVRKDCLRKGYSLDNDKQIQETMCDETTHQIPWARIPISAPYIHNEFQ